MIEHCLTYCSTTVTLNYVPQTTTFLIMGGRFPSGRKSLGNPHSFYKIRPAYARTQSNLSDVIPHRIPYLDTWAIA